jgi:hypothetical protein
MKASIEYCGLRNNRKKLRKSVERERVLWYPKRDRVYKLKIAIRLIQKHYGRNWIFLSY